MTKEREDQRSFEYDRAETIGILDRWLEHSENFFPIDTAVSALHWLETGQPGELGGDAAQYLLTTQSALRAWLANAEPRLPDDLCRSALYWLRRTAT